MTWLEHEASANRPPGSTTASARERELAVGGERRAASPARSARSSADRRSRGPSAGRAARRARRSRTRRATQLVRAASRPEQLERCPSRAAIAGAAMSTEVTASRRRARRGSRIRRCTRTRSARVEPRGVAADRAAVVALIEEEPGLLAGANVDVEPRLVLVDHDLRRRIAAPRPRRRALVAPLAAHPDVRDRAPPRSSPAITSGEPRAPERGRRGAVEHDDRGVVVVIDDEPRAAVALAVDEAPPGAADEQRIALAARGGGLGARRAPTPRRSRASGSRSRIARADRRRRIGERGRERPVVVDDGRDVAGGESVRRRERAVVDPRVPRADPRAQRLGQPPAARAWSLQLRVDELVHVRVAG